MSQESEAGVTEKVMSALNEPDRFVQETVAAARTTFDRCVAEASDYVRTEPVKALGTAAAAGFALRVLPVARIVNTLLRVTLALVRPAMLVYGGAKVWQKIHGITSHDGAAAPAADATRDESKKKEGATHKGPGS